MAKDFFIDYSLHVCTKIRWGPRRDRKKSQSAYSAKMMLKYCAHLHKVIHVCDTNFNPIYYSSLFVATSPQPTQKTNTKMSTLKLKGKENKMHAVFYHRRFYVTASAFAMHVYRLIAIYKKRV